MSKSKDKKNNDNELLSFEELKNKVNHETAKDEKPDSEINDLLSALGDESKDKSQPEPTRTWSTLPASATVSTCAPSS